MKALAELYSPPNPAGCLRMAAEALRAEGGPRRQAALNRLRDYAALLGDPAAAGFHRDAAAVLAEAAASWPHHDYGEGYFYQGMRRLGVTGLRDTEARATAMGLARRLEGLDVLEVGCATGFLGLSACSSALRLTGLDINPFAVRVAELARARLAVANASFAAGSFEDFRAEGAFDAVLSFANHATVDGNTSHRVEDYFAKCRACLRPGGLLLFESHPPSVEGPERLAATVAALCGAFAVETRLVLRYGTRLDSGRTFIAARAL